MKLLRGFPAMALSVVLLSIVGFFVSQESIGLLLVCGMLGYTGFLGGSLVFGPDHLKW